METNWTLRLRDDKSAATAKRIKREVAAMNAELRVLMELAPMASRAMGAVASPSTIRNLRTELGLLKQVNTELRRTGTERRRSERPTGQRAGGGLGGRTRQEGTFSPRQQEQLRGMRQRGIDREARDRNAGRRREENANAAHYRRIHNANVRAQNWGNRRNNVAAGQRQRRAEGRDLNGVLNRAGSSVLSRHFGSAGGGILEGMLGGAGGGRLLAGLGAAGMAGGAIFALVGALKALGDVALSITSTTFQLAGTLASLALTVGQVIFSLGHSVLQMIAFREGALMTLATLARTDGEGLRRGETPDQNSRRVRAQREQSAMGDYNWAQDFARSTPLNMTQVVEMQTQAAAAGYQGANRREMVAAAADAAALHPNDAGTGSRFLLQMGQLRNSSVARSADYRPAAQAAGISETAAMRRAAIAAGVVQRNGENESAYQRRIRTAQGNGQITGRQMHDAILDEQRAMLGGGQSGSFATSQAGSMAAVLSNLGEGAQAFVTSINAIENMPGVRALKGMLTQISDTLAGATENGVYLQTVFAKGLDAAAGMLGGVFGAGGFDGGLTTALAVARDFLPLVVQLASELRGGFMEGIEPLVVGAKQAGGAVGGLRGFLASVIPDARGFARGLGVIAVFMLRITRATVQFVAALISAGRFLPDLEAGFRGAANPIALILNGLNLARAGAGNAANSAIRDAILPPGTRRRAVADWLGIGQSMGDGVAAGFRDRQAHMQAEISSVMASLPATARSDMQIKSPSRVFAEIGNYMAEGVTMGLDSGASGVQSAMSNVVAPPSLPGFGGAMGGGGGPVQIDVGGIHIDGAQDREGILSDLRSQLEEMLVAAFERAQLMAGT